MIRALREVTEEFSPSQNKHHLGSSANSIAWIRGSILEVIDSCGICEMATVRALPNGRILTVEKVVLYKNTKGVSS